MTCQQCHEEACGDVRETRWLGVGRKLVGEVCRARVDLAIRMAVKEHQAFAEGGGLFLDRLAAALLVEFF